MGKKTLLLLPLVLASSYHLGLTENVINPLSKVDRSPKPYIRVEGNTEATPYVMSDQDDQPETESQTPADDGQSAPSNSPDDSAIVDGELGNSPRQDEFEKQSSDTGTSESETAIGGNETQAAVAEQGMVPAKDAAELAPPKAAIKYDSENDANHLYLVLSEAQTGVQSYEVILKAPNGEDVKTETIDAQEDRKPIDLTGLPDGNYVIEITAVDSNGRRSKPFTGPFDLARPLTKPNPSIEGGQSDFDKGPVTVTWEPSKNADHYLLFLVLPDGKELDRGSVTDPRWEIPDQDLPHNGKYTAQVVAVRRQSQQKEKSDPGTVSFEVKRFLAAPIVSIEGENGGEIPHFSDGDTICVQWDEAQEGVDHFGARLSEADDFKPFQSPWSISAGEWPAGQYTVEVKAYGTGKNVESEAGRTSFEIVERPEKPEVTLNGAQDTSDGLLVTEDSLIVSWDNSNGAEGYVLRLVSEDGYSEDWIVKETNYTLNLANQIEGRYAVELTAIGKYDDVRSETASLSFAYIKRPEAPSISIENPTNGLNDLPRYTSRDRVVIRWEEQDGVNSYALALDGPEESGRDFGTTDKKQWSLSMDGLPAGRYTARVSAIGNDGSIASEPAAVSFEVDLPEYRIDPPVFARMSLGQFWRGVYDASCSVHIISTQPNAPENIELRIDENSLRKPDGAPVIVDVDGNRREITYTFNMRDLPAKQTRFDLFIDNESVAHSEGNAAGKGRTQAIIFSALFFILTAGFGLIFRKSSRLYRVARDSQIDNRSGESTLTQRNDHSNKRGTDYGAQG